MKVSNSIPESVILGASIILQPHVKGLDAVMLIRALKEYDPDAQSQKSAAKPAKKTISRQEAAEIIGVSLVTIDKLIRDGAVRSVHIGRSVRLDPDSVAKVAGLAPACV